MFTVTLLPISDVGPNDGTPNPSGAHYLNMDDEPNDGDSTFVTMGFIGFKEVYGIDVSTIPDNATIVQLRVRCTAKRGASTNVTLKAGMRVDGVYQMSVDTPILVGYTSYDFIIAHPDQNPWTKARIASSFLATELSFIEDDSILPRPRFTELVAFVDYVLPAERPTATDASVVGSSVIQSLAPSASAAQVVGGSAVSGIRPDSSAAVIVGGGDVAGIVGSGTPSAVIGGAAISIAGKPTAVPTSVAPRVSAVSMNPTATPSAIRPDASEE